MKIKLLPAGIVSVLLMGCYSFKGNSQTLRIQPVNEVIQSTPLGEPQLWPLTGQVSSQQGAPLSGVTVSVPGTISSTITAADGTYELSVPEQASRVLFSAVGYSSKEIPFSNATILNAVLVEDPRALSELMVTGYSTEQRKNIIGSVGIVSGYDLNMTPTGSVTSQLQGRAPGVVVTSDGTLGGEGKVRIRGYGTLGGADPLYLIDGVYSRINYLNPNDVESIQVLKDAASASSYGMRAANGVIVITTKKGKAGPAKISFNSQIGVNSYASSTFPDVLNAKDFGDLYWKELKGAYDATGDKQYLAGSPNFVGHPAYGKGLTPVLPEYILAVNQGLKYGGTALEALKTSNSTLFNSLVDPKNYNFATHQIVKGADTDWFKAVARTAIQQNYNLSASGGSKAGNYLLSLGLFNQQSPVAKTASYQRYTLRVNSNFNLNKHLRVGENIQLLSNRRQGQDGSFVNAWTFNSLIPVYDIMGNPASSAAPGLVAVGDHGRNPVTEAWRGRFNTNTNYGILGNAYAEVDIVKGLTLRTSFGMDYSSGSALTFVPFTYEHAENTAISGQGLTVSTNNQNTYTWTNTLNYSTSFGKHSLKFFVGSELIKSYAEVLSLTRQSANNTVPAYAIQDDPDFLTISAGVGNQTSSGAYLRNTFSSFFSRVDYSIGDKYLFNASLRRDQSSQLAASARTGYFPALAAGWRISSEEFMKGMDWVSDLKLRASYGVTGNLNALSSTNQYYIYTSDQTLGYPPTGANTGTGTPGYVSPKIGNVPAKWEQNATVNLGVDASFFNRSLNIIIEWYNKKTSGLLVTNQPPFTNPSGEQSPSQPAINAGEILNRGIDLGITKRGSLAEDLHYEAALTFTRYKNKVIKVLDNPSAFLVSGSTRFSTPVSRTQVGLPISNFYGYKIDGFFNTQAEVNSYNAAYAAQYPGGGSPSFIPPSVGSWKIKDVNGDGKIDDNDRTIIGSPHPDFQLGLNLTLNYKNFDFTGFLFWNQGGQLFNYSRYWVDFNTFTLNRTYRMLNDSWTPEHMNARLPKLNLLDSYSNVNVTNYFIESATYLRLKTLQLGYTLPHSLLSKLGLDRLRLYVQAQNLFTAKPKATTAMDPGGSLSGSDVSMGIVEGGNPTPRQFLVGLNLGF